MYIYIYWIVSDTYNIVLLPITTTMFGSSPVGFRSARHRRPLRGPLTARGLLPGSRKEPRPQSWAYPKIYEVWKIPLEWMIRYDSCRGTPMVPNTGIYLCFMCWSIAIHSHNMPQWYGFKFFLHTCPASFGPTWDEDVPNRFLSDNSWDLFLRATKLSAKSMI